MLYVIVHIPQRNDIKMAQSKAHIKASNKYNVKAYDTITLRLYKGNKDLLQQYCKDKSYSINGLVNKLIHDRLVSDGYNYIDKDNNINISDTAEPDATGYSVNNKQ